MDLGRRRLSGPRVAARNVLGVLLLVVASLFGGPALAAPVVTISPNPNPFDYGQWPIFSSSPNQIFTVTNNGAGTPTDDVTINVPSIVGANSAEFVDAGTGTCNAGPVLSGDGSNNCTIHVYFAPAALGVRTATLEVSWTGGGGGTVSANLTGTGDMEIGNNGLSLDISDANLDFGNQMVGTTSAPLSTILKNVGFDYIDIEDVFLLDTTNFSIDLSTGNCDPLTVTLDPGESCFLVVNFHPTAAGPFVTLLAVEYWDEDVGDTFFAIITVTGNGVPPGPVLSASPLGLDFGSQLVGTISPAKSATLTNTGTATLTYGAITDPPNPHFDITGASTCNMGGGTLAPGASCYLVVTFNPQSSGDQLATIPISSDGGDASVVLTGTGIPPGGPVLNVSDSDLNFDPQLVGTTSAPQTVLLSNTGASTLYYGAIAPAPGTHYSVLTPGGLACNAAGGTLAPGATCGFAVTFNPTSAGNKFAAISIAWGDDNTYDFGTAVVALSGLGVATGPILDVHPTNLDFGGQLIGTESTPLSATLVNKGNATLNYGPITGVGIAPAAFTNFSIRDVPSTCNTAAGGTLAPGASCSVVVVFTPQAPVNNKFAYVDINSDGGDEEVYLTGYAVANAPIIQVSDLDLDFGPQTVNITSATLSTTVTNTGNANLILPAPTLTGAEFAIDAAVSTCDDAPATTTGLVPGASCVFALRFTPSATGVRNGSLRIDSNDPARATAPNAPVVNLTGLGTQPPLDNLPVLDFGNVNEGDTSGPLSVSIVNPGAAPITLTNPYFTIGGANAAEFAVISPVAAGYCSNDLVLNPGESCIVTVQFTPAITGTTSLRVALLTGSATNGQTLAVSLTGIGVAVPKLKVFTQTLNFGNEIIGGAGPAQIVQLTNIGTADLVIPAGIRTDGVPDATIGLNLIGPHYMDFIIDPAQSTCDDGVTLEAPDPINANPPGVNNTCYFLVRFQPTAAGTRVAQVQINSNSVGAPHFVSMTGNGVSPPPEPGAPPAEGVNINVNVNISTGIGINPVKVTYNIAGCYEREMFLVINAPAMGKGWSYINTANEFVPIPPTLSMITPWKLIGPYDGTHVLFEGPVPPGTYELYLGCDFVKDGKLNIDVGKHVNGIYDYASVIIK